MNWSSLQVETVGAKPKLGLMCVPLNLIDAGTVFSYLTILIKNFSLIHSTPKNFVSPPLLCYKSGYPSVLNNTFLRLKCDNEV